MMKYRGVIVHLEIEPVKEIVFVPEGKVGNVPEIVEFLFSVGNL